METGDRIQKLDREMSDILNKARRTRHIFVVARAISFGLSLCYILFCISAVFLGNYILAHDYEANPYPSFWEANRALVIILPAFLLISISAGVLPSLYKQISKTQQAMTQKVIACLYPDVECSLGHAPFSRSKIVGSLLFGRAHIKSCHSYGYVKLASVDGSPTITAHDIVIPSFGKTATLEKSQIGAFLVTIKYLLENIVSPYPDAGYGAKGMFVQIPLNRSFEGKVIILPDHMEEKIDYLAQAIQSLKSVHGSKPVFMEDPEFERKFVVYSDDEILARYILTPSMMLRITALRNQYGRDIMCSFVRNTFTLFVPIPEGFLSLHGKQTKKTSPIGELSASIETTKSIVQELKLNSRIFTNQ
ncbi:possible galanin [Porphyromonas crevioricanis JCM 15906]|uniref:Possible galanin n=1 Tax=Porphyromonas crevioricanis JCM 15906 TaxID=1305617 RepID=T1CHU8_9PORP|nr:DUF3137 domain-containing protein [Porphyromonas crevioricanis]GAD05561.1 possible galanin [Porphyromonas crevioricanis JCM 15906]